MKYFLLLTTLAIIATSPSLAEDLCESDYNQALRSYEANAELQQSDFARETRK